VKVQVPADVRGFLPSFLFLLLLGMAPGTARAVPPDEVRALEAGASLIQKPPFGEVAQASAVEVDATGIVSAELLPAGEVLIEARAEGVARVFVFGKRAVRVLQVSVVERGPAQRTSPPPPRNLPTDVAPPLGIKAATCAAAPSSSQGALVAVADDACFRALAAPADDLASGPVAMPQYRFELEGMQAQAQAAQALLGKAGLGRVRVSFSPFGVKLEGAVDAAEKRRAIVAIYPAVLGPLRVDD
jgi:hypothetical protein